MTMHPCNTSERLDRQIRFIIEIDKLKTIRRQTLIMDGSRRENDAEHSWHTALMAVLLSEYAADTSLDLFRVLQMLLIHDLVEIDAGDTFCYDDVAVLDKYDREKKAADRIFNMLPDDQADYFRRLWDEFEERETPESRFASAMDRLQPVLHNYNTNGETWRKNGVKSGQVVSRNLTMKQTAPKLWDFFSDLIDKATRKGLLKK